MTLFRQFVLVTMVLLTATARAGFDHGLLDGFLKEHVVGGMVDYESAGKDARLDAYLEKLASADLSKLGEEKDRLAFYINAYNAYTIKLITSAYPVKSIRLIKDLGETTQSMEDAQPWKIEFAEIAGKTYSLDYIEHEIIRKEFNEPRIHFAIVCAAISCPILRSEAYVGSKLEEQLEVQGRWFFSWRNQFDPKKREARLSKILEWFVDDFGGDKEAVLRFAIPYVNPATAKVLRESGKKWEVSYQVYDWKLNVQE